MSTEIPVSTYEVYDLLTQRMKNGEILSKETTDFYNTLSVITDKPNRFQMSKLRELKAAGKLECSDVQLAMVSNTGLISAGSLSKSDTAVLEKEFHQ